MNQQQRMVAKAAEDLTADAFHQLLDLAITGRGRLPGAKHACRRVMEKKRNPEAAISSLVNQHIALAGGQGFMTNWSGFLVSLVTIPANVAAAAFVQARMVACVAHLRGYELSDPRVRTAILMVMLGPSAVGRGVLPTSPSAVATAPVFDAELDGAVSTALVESVMNQLSGKRLGAWVGKKIPFVGGGVGLAVDGLATRSIAMYALEEFPSRRPKVGWQQSPVAEQPSQARAE